MLGATIFTTLKSLYTFFADLSLQNAPCPPPTHIPKKKLVFFICLLVRFDGPTEGLPDKVLWGYMSATKNPEILIEYNFEKQAINTPPPQSQIYRVLMKNQLLTQRDATK